MALLGLLLIAVAAGFTIDVFVENTSTVDVDVLGRTFSVRPGWIVVAGIVAIVVFLVGARILARGVSRARRRRSVVRDAETAARERDRLAEQLAVERGQNDGTATVERRTVVTDPIPANVVDDADTAADPAAQDAPA